MVGPLAAIHPQGTGSHATLGARIDQYMTAHVAMADFNGRILVGVGDSIIFEAGFSPDGVRASTPATRYGIGSLSKTFTAAAIDVLVRQGRVRLTDTLVRFVPEYPFAGRVTVGQLLAHSAGVPDYYAHPDYPVMRTRAMSTAAFARWIGNRPLDFDPGSRSSYSNSGYALLAGVIERASGLSYADFVTQSILRPARLTETGQLWAVDGPLAAGHNPGPPPKLLQAPVDMDLTWLRGSGSMYSTTRDLFRWTRAIRSDSRFTPATGTYPYGWKLDTVAGDSVIEQTGRVPIGYSSHVTVFSRLDVTIVILSAVQVDVVRQIRDDIAAMISGRNYTVPTVRSRPTLADSMLARYAGRFEIMPGFVLSVRHVGHRLELAGPDGDFLPLDGLGDSAFFFRPLYVTVTFERDADRWDILNWNGAFKARRIP